MNDVIFKITPEVYQIIEVAEQGPAGPATIVQYETFADFPLVGNDYTLYLDMSTEVTYYWDGVEYLGTKSEVALLPDQNFVTDAELAVLQDTSGTNTGDQDLSGKENVGVAAGLDGQHLLDFTHENLPTDNQKSALDAALSPSSTNAFATMQDITDSSVSLSRDLFLCDDAATAPGWHELEAEASSTPTGEHNVVLAVTNTQYELDRYASDPLQVTRFPAGVWAFNIFVRMNSTSGTNLFRVQPCIVHADGSSTIPAGWGIISSADINTTTYQLAIFANIILPAVDPILETDRVGIICYGVRTTGGSSTSTMYMSHDATLGWLSHITPPISLPIEITDVVGLTEALEEKVPIQSGVILGGADALTSYTPTTGQTVTHDYRLGGAYIDCSAFGAGGSLTITVTNWPTTGTRVGALFAYVLVGANVPTLSYTGKGANVTAPTLTASRLHRMIFSSIDAGTTIDITSGAY